MSQGSEEGFEPVQLWLESAQEKRKSTAGNERLFSHIFATQITDVAKRAAAQGNCKVVQFGFFFCCHQWRNLSWRNTFNIEGFTVTQAGCYSHPLQEKYIGKCNSLKGNSSWKSILYYLEDQNVWHELDKWLWRRLCALLFFCHLSKDTKAPSRAAW